MSETLRVLGTLGVSACQGQFDKQGILNYNGCGSVLSTLLLSTTLAITGLKTPTQDVAKDKALMPGLSHPYTIWQITLHAHANAGRHVLSLAFPV